MGNTYLAVDLGASGGRLICGWIEDGRLILDEVHRFENGPEKVDGTLCWDYDRIFEEILTGMEKCGRSGRVPVSMGVDTWGVDFVLLDPDGNRIGKTVSYRDQRTSGMDIAVGELISQQELYRRTGILKADYNTIYQLMAVKKNAPEQLEAADALLMVPDYFHYLLTGRKTCEYTEATTTQLIDPVRKDWDFELVETLGYPGKLFLPLIRSGSRIGVLRPELAERVGFAPEIIAPAAHDTASAIAAIPYLPAGQGESCVYNMTEGCVVSEKRSAVRNDDENGASLYLSSGTWSLMGTELESPDCSDQARQYNFTNEGGYEDSVCFHKNIMGLWMIQSVRHEMKDRYSFAELCVMAEENPAFPSRVDVNDACFLSPDSMTNAVRAFCSRTNQAIPETPGELANVIYRSLADCYAKTAEDLERLTGKTYDRLCIAGGGSNADYLNQLTADAIGKPVYAGPSEATAIGNLVAQMISRKEIGSLAEAKEMIRDSFPVRAFLPAEAR